MYLVSSFYEFYITMHGSMNIMDRFLFPAELYCLNTDCWSINDCNVQHVWFQGVARHEKRISTHLATVCSHQQHNRPHDVTGSCLIGLQLAVGSRKLIYGSNKSCPQDFRPVGFRPCFFQSRDHYFGCTTQSRLSRCHYVLV